MEKSYFRTLMHWRPLAASGVLSHPMTRSSSKRSFNKILYYHPYTLLANPMWRGSPFFGDGEGLDWPVARKTVALV